MIALAPTPVSTARRIFCAAHVRTRETAKRAQETRKTVPLKRRRVELVRMRNYRRAIDALLDLDLSDDAPAEQITKLRDRFTDATVCDAILWAVVGSTPHDPSADSGAP